MPKKKDFFTLKNSARSISKEERLRSSNYLESVKAFARLTNQSLYVINYAEMGFEYVSENPLFLCGYSAEEVLKMGYDFYLNTVPEQDLKLLLEINRIGFDFYDTIPLEERKLYTISYDFNLKTEDQSSILINHKLTPLFLDASGKIWKALCIVSLASSESAGNIKIYKQGDQNSIRYNLASGVWETVASIQLTSREQEILQLSIRGFKVDQIAQELNLSLNTIKYHRKKLFEKLDVTTIVEAITCATRNNLI